MALLAGALLLGSAGAALAQTDLPTFPAVTGVYADAFKDDDGKNRIKVWWNRQSTDVNPGDDYRVQFRHTLPWGPMISVGGTYTRTNPLILPNPQFDATGLLPRSTYHVRVRAGEENCTCPWTMVQLQTLGTLGQVTGVTVTPGVGKLEVSWTALTGATGYRVQWKTAEQSYSNAVRFSDVSGNTTTTYTISSGNWLTEGSEYTVRVFGTTVGAPVDADIGPGPVSAEVTGTPLPAAPTAAPGQVTGLTLTAGVQQVAASWTSDSQATSYEVQWKSGSQSFGTSRQASVTGTSHTIASLARGTAFTVRVRATNSVGDGACGRR